MSQKALIFDFDGTIADTFPNYIAALEEFSHNHDLTFDADKFTVGYVDPDQFDLGWGIPLYEQRDLYETFNAWYNDENAHNRRFLPTLFPGMMEVLQSLSDDYAMAIVTTRHRHSLEAILKHNAMEHLFTAVRTHQCAQEGHYDLKPAPDAIYHLLDEKKYKIDDIIVIGDTTADIGMANAVGAKSIAVLWGAHPQDRLQTESPLVMIDTVEDLPGAVEGIFAT